MAGLRVVAHITPKAGKAEELKTLLLGLIDPTLAEDGCMKYELHRNIDDSEFTFIEEWTSADALTAHFATDHLVAALAAFEQLAENVDVRKYELIR